MSVSHYYSFCYGGLAHDFKWPLPLVASTLIPSIFLIVGIAWLFYDLKVFTRKFWNRTYMKWCDFKNQLQIVFTFLLWAICRNRKKPSSIQETEAFNKFKNGKPLNEKNTAEIDLSSNASTQAQLIEENAGYVDAQQCGNCTKCMQNGGCPMRLWRELQFLIRCSYLLNIVVTWVVVIGLIVGILAHVVHGNTKPNKDEDDSILKFLCRLSPPWNVEVYNIIQLLVVQTCLCMLRRAKNKVLVGMIANEEGRKLVLSICLYWFCYAIIGNILMVFGNAHPALMKANTLNESMILTVWVWSSVIGITWIIMLLTCGVYLWRYFHMRRWRVYQHCKPKNARFFNLSGAATTPFDLKNSATVPCGSEEFTLDGNKQSSQLSEMHQINKEDYTENISKACSCETEELSSCKCDSRDQGKACECCCGCCSADGKFRIKLESPEKKRMNWCSFIFVSWVSPIISLGRVRALELRDVFYLPKDLYGPKLKAEFEHEWRNEVTKNGEKAMLAKTVLWFGRKYVIISAGLQICISACQIGTPLVTKRLMEFIRKCSDTLYSAHKTKPGLYVGDLLLEGLVLLCINAGIHLLTTLFQQHFHRVLLRLGVQSRSAILSVVYDKSLRCAIDDPALAASETTHDHLRTQVKEARNTNAAASGKLLNLMAADTQNIIDALSLMHMLWSTPLAVCVGLYYVWVELGPTTIIAAIILFLCIPTTMYIVHIYNKQRLEIMALRDHRVKLTNEAFSAMRTLKMQGWEDAFEKGIIDLRNLEVKTLWNNQFYTVLERTMWLSVPTVTTLACFGAFSFLGKKLSPTQAFTAVNLINSMGGNVIEIPRGTSACSFGWISCKRIQKFLLRPEVKTPSPVPLKEMSSTDVPTIIADNLSVRWPNKSPLLDRVSFVARPGTITAIVGTTGSGKTGLGLTIIGNLEPEPTTFDKKDPSYLTVTGRLSYAAQKPWIQNATLRSNVLFGKPYDPIWYEQVIGACALKEDLEVLPHGDQTEIGEKGLNLSGGQKQRIALARTIYQSGRFQSKHPNNLPADIYVLDDCLASVDVQVSEHIFKNAIAGILMDMKRTVVLITNKTSILPHVDQIIVLSPSSTSHKQNVQTKVLTSSELTPSAITPGRSVAVGTFKHVKDLPEFKAFTEETCCRRPELHKESSVTNDTELLKYKYASQHSTKFGESCCERHGGERSLTGKETMEDGAVSIYVYWSYAKTFGGPIIVTTVIILIACWLASKLISRMWLSKWTAENSTIPALPTGAGVYALIGISDILFNGLATGGTYWRSNRVSRLLHHRILQKLLAAPMHFYEASSFGRLLNRLVGDFNMIDQTLPFAMFMSVVSLFKLLFTFISEVLALPAFIFVLVPLMIIYALMLHYYLPTARQLQRLDSVLQSPLFSHIQDTVDGMVTVRASRSLDRFRKENEQRLDNQLRAYYVMGHGGIWLSIRLEILGLTITIIAGLLAVLSALAGTLSVNVAGFALSYANEITATLTLVLSCTIKREMDIVAVERVEKYLICTPTESLPDQITIEPPKSWPAEGAVTFKNFCMKYRPELPDVLFNVSFKILPKEKVGIVGRTGAGKTSLMVALSRLVEASSGSILIDDFDISHVPLKILRSRLAVIPQDPVLFTGTLRFNLDPFNAYTDEQIWAALERVHLKDFISTKFDKQLMGMIKEEGVNISAGQRQLICLGRAILRRSTVLLMDEATSAVDPMTDKLIQKTIREEFKNSTVIAIAHRLETIMDFDRVIVMDYGTVVEIGPPRQLLENSSTILSGLYAHSDLD